MDRIRNILMIFRSQLWPIPLLIMFGATGLAWLVLGTGETFVPQDGSALWWLYSGEAATARDLLGGLLSGLMTMTSLVVSITFVILTLAASQLGPRLIAIFMGDRQIQGVLGLFIGTILYVILIMRQLDDPLGSEGVPHLAVTIATILTILCLLALLFYLHKIARLIIADNVVDEVAGDLRDTFRDILPKDDGTRDAAIGPGDRPPGPRAAPFPVALNKAGYVQVADYGRLVDLACAQDLLIEVTVRAGHYLLRQGAHLRVHAPAGQALAGPDEKTVKDIRAAFTIGAMRTPAQDPEQGIRQLVEIATRALSPGINDPFTALAVIDRMGMALEEAFGRADQACVFRDDAGCVRVIANRAGIGGLIDAGFHPIRQAGGGHPGILIHLADTIGALGPAIRTRAQARALDDQLDRLTETAALGRMTRQDGEDVAARIALAREEIRREA